VAVRCRLTFAVLAAGAAGGVAVAGELVVRRGLAGEGVCRVGLVGEGVHHGPGRGPGEGQGGQRVLVRGPAGAVVVVQGEVGHVWAGEEQQKGCLEVVRFGNRGKARRRPRADQRATTATACGHVAGFPSARCDALPAASEIRAGSS